MKKRNIINIIYIFFIFTAGLSQAGQFAVSIARDQVEVGEKVEISLIFLEAGSGKNAYFHEEINCELITGGKKYDVLARKNVRQEGPGIKENPSGIRQNYSFMLPSVLQGQVVMSFSGVDAPRVVFDVVVPQADNLVTAKKVSPRLDSMFTAYEPFQKNAGSYEPVYFLVGTNPENSKFQISFKYRFFDADTHFAESYPWIQGLHLGYTQTSFWDLKSDSAPFDDTSYKPELFWLSQNFLQYERGLLKGVFLQSGLQHESNGRGGDLSRSTNYLYIKPIFVFYDNDSRLGLELSPKIWVYVNNEDETNADLPDYRGYFDLGAKFGLAESFEVGSQFRWADEGMSFQFDFSYPLNNLFGDALDIYFYAQYTNALAESLLDFEDRTQSFRLGLALIR